MLILMKSKLLGFF